MISEETILLIGRNYFNYWDKHQELGVEFFRDSIVEVCAFCYNELVNGKKMPPIKDCEQHVKDNLIAAANQVGGSVSKRYNVAKTLHFFGWVSNQ